MTNNQLKVLQFCIRIPYPPKDGGNIAMHNMTQGFSEYGCDLTIFTYNTKKHYYPVDKLPDSMKNYGRMVAVDIDTTVRPFPAFFNLFTNKSYNIQRFVDKNVAIRLKELLEEESFDVIHCEGLYTSMYIDLIKKHAGKAKVVMRSHNVEHKIWERLAKESKGIKKWYLKLLANRLRKHEIGVTKKFDAIVPITEIDEDFYKETGAKNIFVSSTGLDMRKFEKPAHLDEETDSVFHLGALDWMPNQNGLKWFLDHVWPMVIDKRPSCKFYIAGRHTPKWVYEYHGLNNIQVIGEVEDANAFAASKSVMVVPLWSGSGMRIKLIEGMARGKCIVTTTVGAEGIAVESGKHMMIADDPEVFASSIVSLTQKPEVRAEMSHQARKFIEENYDNSMRISELIGYYEQLTGRSPLKVSKRQSA